MSSSGPGWESGRSAAQDDPAEATSVSPAPSGGSHVADASAPDGKPAPAAPAAERAAEPPVAADSGPDGDKPAFRQKKPKKKAPWWEMPLLLAVAIVIAVIIKTFVVQPFYIPSQSMEKTLHGCPGCSGDRVLVNKPVYDFRDPHPGDIVVFKAPSDWADEAPVPGPPGNPILKVVRGFGQLVGVVPPDERDLIKRVIAVGGQTVQCCDSQGNVQVADSPTGPFRSLNEPYVFRDANDWAPGDTPGQAPAPGDTRTFGPVTVPKDRLFVMGDHRNNSADSAFHWRTNGHDAQASTVAIDSVIGKAFVIAWPPSRWRTLGTPATFKTGALGPPLAGAAVAVPLGLLRRRRRRSTA